MARHTAHRNTGRVRGYTTVFLAIIMSVYSFAIVVMIDIASVYAARSIADNVCAVAGRSVLSEYQSELFKRYGIFLLRNAEKALEIKADLYLNSSLCQRKGLVKFSFAAADLDMYFYPGWDRKELSRQIGKLALGPNEYILTYFSSCTDRIPDTYCAYEIERIICGHKTDTENHAAIKQKLTSMRFAVNLATMNKEDLDISAIGTFIETVIPGNLDDAAVEVVQALEQAKRDADILMAGGSVPLFPGGENFGKYKDYLRMMLLLMPEDIKYSRMMEIMETNLLMMDRVIFSFSSYVYGFDMKVVLKKKPLIDVFGLTDRVRIVTQHFCYK